MISSTEASRDSTALKSVIDPVGTGTRRAVPSRRPFMDSITSAVARAAPVEVGVMLMAAPRARRRSLWGPSTSIWSPVYAWTVVMRPFSMPNASSSTLTSGTKQLVVQDALDTTLSLAGSKSSWLTP